MRKVIILLGEEGIHNWQGGIKGTSKDADFALFHDPVGGSLDWSTLQSSFKLEFLLITGFILYITFIPVFGCSVPFQLVSGFYPIRF